MATARSDPRAVPRPSSSAGRGFFAVRRLRTAFLLTLLPIAAGWAAAELDVTRFQWALGVAAVVLAQAALLWLVGRFARRLPESPDSGEPADAEAEGSRRSTPEDVAPARKARSRFLADMSHELRTPVNSILGASELMLDQGLPEAQREYVDIVRTSSSDLLRVIEEILDYSNVEAGKLAIEAADFSLTELLRDVIDTLKPQAEASGLELRLEKAPGIPRRLRGDRDRLRQVLHNLVANAVRHTSRGHVILAVESFPAEDRIELGFAVQDTGQGLDATAREDLFSPFPRVDGSGERAHGGTGLGLAISRGVVEAMGGSIEVDSTPGAGSTFFVSLPFDFPIDADENERVARPPARATRSRQAARVLIVEDEAVNRLIAVRLLEQLGYRAQAVTDGRAALEALKRGRFDLVLMDCQMPELDGYAATRLIRQQETEGWRIPIIAVTAHALRGDREKCLAAGMDDYLAKPFRENELSAVLARWIGSDGGERPSSPPADALDPATLATLLRLDDEAENDFLSRAILGFLHHESPKLDAMRRALGSDDTRHLMEAAHSLCGAAGSLGAFHLSKLCGELVDLAQYRTLNECRIRLRDVEREFERTVGELKKILGEPVGGTSGRRSGRSA